MILVEIGEESFLVYGPTLSANYPLFPYVHGAISKRQQVCGSKNHLPANREATSHGSSYIAERFFSGTGKRQHEIAGTRGRSVSHWQESRPVRNLENLMVVWQLSTVPVRRHKFRSIQSSRKLAWRVWLWRVCVCSSTLNGFVMQTGYRK